MAELMALLPLAGGIVFGVLALFLVLKHFLYICNPNEILIFAGRKHTTETGHSVGYRVVFGGRALRIPVLESVERMDMRVMPIDVRSTNAYSKGGIPLHIRAVANVKISNQPAVAGNAIERFLGKSRDEIERVAKETLEGNLRGVVATMTPEQVNEDRLRFAERISADVDRDLGKLGLQLDTLKIQSVADDVDYLESIGRKQIALIIRDAEIAESDAQRQAATVQADCVRRAEVAKTDARNAIQQKENELRKIKADLALAARSEEQRTEAAAEEARARAEQKLQAIRSELERLRLEADEVLPAEARRAARELVSRGAAAPLAEDARATAAVNDMLAALWRDAGSDASKVFLLQEIESVLAEVAKVIEQVTLGDIAIIEDGDGSSIPDFVAAWPEAVRRFLVQFRDTVGIDIVGTLTGQQEGTP